VTDRNVRSLLWDNYRGLTDVMINRVLRGEETYPDTATGRQRPLWPRLLYHRLRGCDPGARIDDVRAALDRLNVAEQVIRTGDGLWRLRRYAEADERRERTTAGQTAEVAT
jgi:ATP-dependent DNA helicase RecQ